MESAGELEIPMKGEGFVGCVPFCFLLLVEIRIPESDTEGKCVHSYMSTLCICPYGIFSTTH